MITLIDEKYKPFSQKSYNKLVENIDLHSLTCSCKIKGNFIKYGTYTRMFINNGEYIAIKIQRVYCKSCKKTHALMTKELVPYSQISMLDHFLIINAYLSPEPAFNKYEEILINNELINENSIRYIINKYIHFWNAALISLNLSLKNDRIFLIKKCLTRLKIQFMQIKSTTNILFSTTNIT